VGFGKPGHGLGSYIPAGAVPWKGTLGCAERGESWVSFGCAREGDGRGERESAGSIQGCDMDGVSVLGQTG
jgi:hypothetical protein